MSASTSPRIEPDQAARSFGTRVPLAIVPGLVLMGIAVAVDAVAHAGVLTSLEAPAHLLGVLGMVLTWIAVVADGVRYRSRPR